MPPRADVIMITPVTKYQSEDSILKGIPSSVYGTMWLFSEFVILFLFNLRYSTLKQAPLHIGFSGLSEKPHIFVFPYPIRIPFRIIIITS